MEKRSFSPRHFFDFVLRNQPIFYFVLQNQPIFKIWKFEIRHVCQKIRHVCQKILTVLTQNWRITKWRHFVIRSRWVPYNCPHSQIIGNAQFNWSKSQHSLLWQNPIADQLNKLRDTTSQPCSTVQSCNSLTVVFCNERPTRCSIRPGNSKKV